ncbi:HK97 gp10 family phage protein [Paenalcaligenes sp. Me131]|uniref:HK97 gp10 family phage protein n=1 Tax=Paenalcaligenes sp. Me131 TaxID=3392636 RepID=UPI003D2CA18D
MVETTFVFDVAEVEKRLEGLGVAAKTHLPRSMAVAAGKILRDAAKSFAPVYDGSTGLKGGANAIKAPTEGLLRDSIYLAFSDDRSDTAQGRFVYSVSWNAKTAPHGHLLEFGHWRYNKIIWDMPRKEELPEPEWVAAKPFLRPGFDAHSTVAIEMGIARGKERLAELLANPSELEKYA